MEKKIVSLREFQIEKQYRTFYENLNNYNYSLKLVGSAPKHAVEIKKSKTS